MSPTSSNGRKKRRQMDAIFGRHDSRRSIDLKKEQINMTDSDRSLDGHLRVQVTDDDFLM